ncbi:hypothetical protein B0A48_10444 [Cryoendolithus antarcticus]|uniref:F-box domain-containing protein n=1 Tax=Cryoendolithus antarcticus TaxID=1507870 RepID=A0A1V8SXJ3_9PEZI|nr:hypothetical protein B0A48_10444 [Cryoendolithus antarcticus]
MAGLCHLLNLPGELRNNIYDCIHLNEGIEVIKDRTRPHPLGYTCRQLHLEITSHTAAHATLDAAIDVRTWVFDFDFSDIAKWLDQHPCVDSDLEPRFLKLHLVTRPSTSLAGLPLEGDKNDDYEIHLPISERRLCLLERNMETWKVGRWNAENFKKDNEDSMPDPGLPRYLDLHHRSTKCQYIVRFTMKLLEPERYHLCWPKPRKQTAEMPASFQERFKQPGHDYIARIKRYVFQRYRYPVQAERDFDDCNVVLWSENVYARQYSEERHKLYDRNLLVSLKCAEVRSMQDADWLERIRWESMEDCFKGVRNPRRKREAEDDTRDERKKRAIDVAGMGIEKQWRAEVAETPQWDDAMDIDVLTDGLTSIELEKAAAED